MNIPEWLNSAIVTYGYWVLFIATGLECMGVPLPAETSLVAISIYAGTMGNLNIAVVIVAAASGAIIGDNLGYSIGRIGGYPLLKRIAKVVRIGPGALDSARDYFARRGAITVFVGRFIALARLWAALLAGASRMPWRSFLFWNATGGILWATTYGVLGYALGHNLPLLARILNTLDIVGKVVLGLLVIVVAVGWAWRRHRKRAPA